ncbi:MAG: putative Ig domain-containing protein, partial [Candidatus Kerfeldbacteria bacterium]|nr:putative Ig domain-containing protein [Candidatus Kerfeldbacteria bacterium]
FRLSLASYNLTGVHSRVAWSSQIAGELLAWGALPQADNLQDGTSNLEMYFITYTAAESLTITTASLPAAMVGSAYSQTLTATGGTAPLTWSLNIGSLPAGLTLSSAGVISGTPTTSGTASFTVQLTDSVGVTVISAQSITVQPPANHAPVLSFSLATGYITDGINPSVSFTNSPPTFKVVYSDADNNPPAPLKLFINNTSYDLSAESGADGDFSNGEHYTFTPPVGTLAKGIYNYHFTASDGTVATRLPATSELVFEVRYDPVIIVPGIMGSAEKNGVWIIDPILHTYDDLIETLKVNGYTEGQDLFTFAYDWRWNNTLTAVSLQNKINQVQAVCGCAKVDLVAHSMGGLVARSYIQSDRYENDIDQLIFLGTPHLGAPKAYLMWEGGEFGVEFEDRFQKFMFSREAKRLGFSSLFDYVKNGPITSAQQLLPIYDYLRDKNASSLRTYPNNYPRNTFLENLKDNISGLLDSGVRITNIVGELDESSTINSIRVVPSAPNQLWEHGYPDGFDGSTADRGLEVGKGDATVPIESSSYLDSDLQTLVTSHLGLPTKAEALVFKKLIGTSASELIDNSRFINIRFLIIKILSPVDVVIIAPDGKRVGKDFSTSQELNEIEGAFYSGFVGDDEYVTIPNPLDGEYKIMAQGADNGGFYTAAVGYLSDEQSVERDFTAQTTPGLVTELKLQVDNVNPETLDIKPADVVPPVITVVSPQSKDYLRSEVLPIEMSVTDIDSGVATKKIKFDDRIIQSGDSIDLFFEKLGSHKLLANAADFVGNVAQSEIPFRVIATPESTISDIERAFTLGWITSKGVKESLVRKLKLIVRLEKRIKFLEEKLPGKPKIVRRIEIIEKKIDRLLAKAIRGELKVLRGKHINEQAYNLLSEDINWLLDY